MNIYSVWFHIQTKSVEQIENQMKYIVYFCHMVMLKRRLIFDNLGYKGACNIMPWDSWNLPKILNGGDFYMYWLQTVGSDSEESTCNVGDPGLIPGLGRSLEKGMATHSSILAWRIPWAEEPGRLQSMGIQRVGHDWENNTFTFDS